MLLHMPKISSRSLMPFLFRSLMPFPSRYSMPFLCALILLLLVYLPTLQTIPNGSDEYYMVDVGETQVVLNVWGTLHATGYPLYVMLSAALTALFKLFGATPAAAPALTSLVWGSLALALLYTLMVHLTDRAWFSAAALLLFGMLRTVWIHQVIAEIYSFGLIFVALLLLIALWRKPMRGRIYWLALIGGLGVGQHRALILLAPALLYAVWGELSTPPHRLRRLIFAILLGLVGLLPYIYLPLREWAGAAWVYGDVGNWQGFLDQFLGREADRYVGLPQTWEALWANFALINNVLLTDATLPGMVIGIAGLIAACFPNATDAPSPPTPSPVAPLTGEGRKASTSKRRAAITLIISGLASYLFHGALYSDVLSALILHVLVSVAFGWLFFAEIAARTMQWQSYKKLGWWIRAAAFYVALALADFLYFHNHFYINVVRNDPRGVETIEQVQRTPPGSTLLIGWGTRHSAAGFAIDVLGLAPGVTLVDHNADVRAILQNGGELVTPEYSFYTFPIDWWQTRLGGTVYLEAAAPYLVRVSLTPRLATDIQADFGAVPALICEAEALILSANWYTPEKPTRDLSVFVHLLDAQGTIIAQADQNAPVYGWRPLTTWVAGELVRDYYLLPRLDGAVSIRYGLYHQETDGAFVNDVEYEVAVGCE
jgi:hypothetical protein